jgi:hypothetical protein
MHSIHSFSKSLASLALLLVAVSGASNAFAAGGHGDGMGGGHGGGHFGGGFRSGFVNQEIPMQAPVFNPSEHYAVTQSPEAPVSPGSPGSVFGDR